MKKNKKQNNKIIFVDEKKAGDGGFSKSKIIPKTAQDTIPFDEVYENGIFRKDNTFSVIFMFENTDYLIMRDEEKDMFYRKYQHFLDVLPQNVNYQEFIMSYPIERAALRDAMIPQYDSKIFDREIFDDYCEIMDGVIKKSEQNSSEQIILGALSYTPKTKLDNVNILFKYFREIENQALSLGSNVTLLSPEKSFEIIHRLYHLFDNEPFLLPTSYLQADVSLKDYIAPSSFTFRNKLIDIGSSHSCVMFVKRFARECDDEFITSLLDNTYNVVVSKHLMRIDKSESLKILKKQMDDLQGRLEKRREINHKRGGSFIPYSLQSREKELTELQNRLGDSNCDLFSYGIYILISAPTEPELYELREFIRQKALEHQVIVDVLTGTSQQEAGLQCILPFANPVLTSEGQYLGQPFYLTTDEVANFIPFSYYNQFKKGGLYYGINKVTNTPIIIDRTDGLNANGFTVGTSGSGKSMFTKSEMFAAMLQYPEDEFIAIDPENEYKPLAEQFNGEIIKLSPNTNTYLNIFDTDLSYADDGASAIAMKSDFVMTFCECAKGIPLSAKERSVIDRCVKLVYQPFLLSDGNKNNIPTLPDFYKNLKEQPEQEALDIALAIELYVEGSFNIFAHHTNIQYHKNFIIYDIFEMGNQLQTVGLLVLLELLWQRVIDNKLRGVRTWVWCDEFSIMFNDSSSGDEIYKTGDFFVKVFKRIRKHGGIASGATQNISEVMASKQAMTMLSNAEFVTLLAQKKDDLKKIVELWDLSDNQSKYINTDKPGTGLIILGKRIIPFENLIPEKSKMYRICTTKFKDLQNVIKQGEELI